MAFKEECGVFAIWNHEHAARLTFLGIYALQHRGQEAAGIVCFDTVQRYEHKGLGLVSEIFTDENIAHLPGRQGIGHVRYSTTGQNSIKNAQPLTAQLRLGEIALAHNGNIVNYAQLSQKLQASGAALFASTDSEIFLHLLSREDQTDLGKGFLNVCSQVEGAFSLVVLTNKCLVAIRDPHGFRPLVLGYVTNDRGEKSPVVTSETCALDLIGAEFAREIAPGEIFVVTEEGERSYFLPKKDRLAHCIFEHVYFARPDSVVFGKSVYLARKKMGAELAKESPVDADLVIPVPDSGIPSALGFSDQSKIPFELGIIRNQYVGRTFLQPLQSMRDYGVKIKLNPQWALLSGKKVVVIDDSLVRGTTSRKIINLIRQSGAKEVHVRIASPPTVSPCYYGVDTPQKAQLIAAHYSHDQIRDFIGADSLAYLTIEGMMRSYDYSPNTHCAACFDGKYPTELFESLTV